MEVKHKTESMESTSYHTASKQSHGFTHSRHHEVYHCGQSSAHDGFHRAVVELVTGAISQHSDAFLIPKFPEALHQYEHPDHVEPTGYRMVIDEQAFTVANSSFVVETIKAFAWDPFAASRTYMDSVASSVVVLA